MSHGCYIEGVPTLAVRAFDQEATEFPAAPGTIAREISSATAESVKLL